MPSNFGTMNTVSPPRKMVTKSTWSTSPESHEHTSPTSVQRGRATIVTGRNVTKFSKLYNGSIRRKLRGLHAAIHNVEALAALYKGGSTKPPLYFAQNLENVFDDSCTALTASLRNPSIQGVQEWSHDQICEELKSQFSQGFKWELLNIEVYNPPREITYEIRATNGDTDVTFVELAYVRDGKIERIERQHTLYSLSPLKKCMEDYFALFNGETQVPDNFRNAFDSVYDPSAVSISSKGRISCDLMYESCLMLFARGAKMQLTSIETHEKGISYTVSCQGRGVDFTSQSMAEVEQGRVVKIAPLRKKKYSTRSQPEVDEERSTRRAIENIKSLFSLFTGMRKVPEEFYEVFGDIYDGVVEAEVPAFVDGEEFDQLNFYELQEEFIAAFRMGLTMKIIEIERKSPGKVLYTIQAYNDSTQMMYRDLLRVKNGKIYKVIRKGTNFSVLPLIKAFREYIAMFSGEKLYPDTWKERLEAIMSKNEVFIQSGRKVFHYDRICRAAERLLMQQSKVHIGALSRHKKGFLYELTYEIGGESQTVSAAAVVAWGRIVRIEPFGNGEFYQRLYGDGNDETTEEPSESTTFDVV